MKKFIVLLLLACIACNITYCQITKGNWLLGGNASFASTNYKSDAGSKSIGFDLKLTPNIGYFIIDKLAAGAKVGIGKNGFKAQGTSVSSTYTDFNIGPFVRYYLLSSEKLINILTEVTYQYGFAGGNGVSKKPTKSTFAFATGPAIYFNNSVGLEFLIGYSTYKYATFLGSNNTIQFSIGFQFYLEKDK
ncbi:MAG: hypothetical protein H7211_09940 [Aquabacterium sp.]|nr:hypothetical protein [Ferruginibacter sp.]